MKLKALVSFVGTVSAGMGQEFTCSAPIGKDLVNAGYAKEIKTRESKRNTSAADSKAD